MPLSVEFFHPKYKKWENVTTLLPGQPPETVRQHMPEREDGKRIYAAECDQSDRFSSLFTYKIPNGTKINEIDIESPQVIREVSVLTIEKGKALYYSIKSSREKPRLVVRFWHY